jgi:hypothetical protein
MLSTVHLWRSNLRFDGHDSKNNFWRARGDDLTASTIQNLQSAAASASEVIKHLAAWASVAPDVLHAMQERVRRVLA